MSREAQSSQTNHLHQWIQANELDPARRGALWQALLTVALAIAALIGGSIVQGMLKLPVVMGWGQQLAALLASVLIAWALGEPRALLGLRWPARQAWLHAVWVGLSITAVGWVAERFLPPDPAPLTIEYFLYEATMPGLGEEFSMRGAWLCLLVVGLSRFERLPGRAALALAISALPFAALHVLEVSGLQLVVIFLYTFYAAVALGWLRLSSASIWPAVLAHNVANVAGGVISLLLRH
ncbi:CPBP family glutamic-type intramembrane protease [Paucibacter sp. APW11]|uniref:CPBP family glutamic-type intramembrane protease n=1 Tax=Roseateles aquae TaxID=3077235 RepID=A0ABU3PCJ0_9BURK|nr:CPBP family glutamic-type intramembrane protease [Paucibacter sp. APW11]MDT8999566.1 CPBP family glutamic-type intramembrane protease [Paucibacter sp. APW11]